MRGSIKPVVDRLDAERTASEAAKEESSQATDVDVYTLLDLLLEPVRARDGALLKRRTADRDAARRGAGDGWSDGAAASVGQRRSITER